MKRIGLLSVVSVLILLAAGQVRAQQDDPSETFLKAYLTAQQAEKLERENHFKTALAKYRFAGSLIEELRKSRPDWQPAIVEYRGRKISEGILRIQDKAATQNELATSPQNANPLEGGNEVVTSDAAIKPRNCAAKLINCNRPSTNRAAILRPRGKKRSLWTAG